MVLRHTPVVQLADHPTVLVEGLACLLGYGMEGLGTFPGHGVAGVLAAQFAHQREQLFPVLQETHPVVAHGVPCWQELGVQVVLVPHDALLEAFCLDLAGVVPGNCGFDGVQRFQAGGFDVVDVGHSGAEADQLEVCIAFMGCGFRLELGCGALGRLGHQRLGVIPSGLSLQVLRQLLG